jgi:O-antigen ligase
MSDAALTGEPTTHDPDGAGRRPLVFIPPKATLRSRLDTGLEYWRTALIFIAVVLTPVLAYVGNLGFAAMVSLVGIGALVFLGRKSQPSIGVAILLALLLWGLFSMSWSPAVPVHPDFHRYKTVQGLTGVKLVLELAFYGAFIVAFKPLSEAVAARASLVLAFGLTALAVLLLVEAVDGAALYQWIKAAAHQKTRPDLAARNVARGCYVAAVLFWPVVLRLRRAHLPLLVAVFVLALAVSAVIFKVDSPILALLLAAGVFAAVQAFGRGAIWTLLAGVVIYFASAPLVAHYATGLIHPNALAGGIAKQSWAVRLDIWRFVSAEILQNPLRGWGLDASRSWPNDIPLHPHDAALQLWLELGVAGAALAALFWAWMFSRIGVMVEGDRNMAAAAAATATAYLTIGALSFGVWQEWWLAVGAIAIVVCNLVSASRHYDHDAGQEFTVLPRAD